MRKTISVIIVNHNTLTYTQHCLSSIQRVCDPQYDYEVIVVDNASTDSTVNQLRRAYPWVAVIRNDTNLGFARANNQAMLVAQGDFLLLLNSDTVILSHAVAAMAEALERDERVGIAGCQLLYPDLSIQPCAGNFPTIYNLIRGGLPLIRQSRASYFIRSTSYYHAEQQPDWLMGACMMIHRRLLDEIGMFDEDFFMYGEDVDFCYRARRHRYNIKYLPQGRIIHYDLGTTAPNRLAKFLRLRRGLLLFYRKHYSASALRLLKVLMRLEVMAALAFRSDPHEREAYRGVLTIIGDY